MNAQVLRRLHIRHAPILDQAHSLKLELSRELPPLHDPPPAPSKHLTRCLRNRVQANQLFAYLKNAEKRGPEYSAVKGVLLYPAVGETPPFEAMLQGHEV